MRAPIAVVVEAKKNDIDEGLGRYVVRMVATDQFIRSADAASRPVHGCVTTGETWQFLKLDGEEAWMDRRRYDIDDVGRILGVLPAISAEDGEPACFPGRGDLPWGPLPADHPSRATSVPTGTVRGVQP